MGIMLLIITSVSLGVLITDLIDLMKKK